VPLSVAAFDIDHFKRVNDSIGHAGGDAVLVHFAELIRKQVRDADVLARVGGEEFLLLLRGLDGAGAARAVERIRAAVEASVCLWQGQPVPFTVSIGVAERRVGEALELPWERADQALYEAKHGGRNRVVCAAPVA
jgi:diguanylate cyclase